MDLRGDGIADLHRVRQGISIHLVGGICRSAKSAILDRWGASGLKNAELEETLDIVKAIVKMVMMRLAVARGVKRVWAD